MVSMVSMVERLVGTAHAKEAIAPDFQSNEVSISAYLSCVMNILLICRILLTCRIVPF